MVGLGLYLDVFGSESHVLVWVLRNFWRKIAKRSKEGKLGKSGLRRNEGCLATAKPRAKMATHGFTTAELCYAAAAKALFIEAKFFGFCSESLVFVH